MKLNRDKVKAIISGLSKPKDRESYVAEKMGITIGTYLRRCREGKGWTREGFIALGCILGEMTGKKRIKQSELELVVDEPVVDEPVVETESVV